MGQLQQLVDCAFKMATGQTEALRPIGLRLLRTLLRYFGAAEDPAMEGARLMEQYQAQFVSALRCDAAYRGFAVGLDMTSACCMDASATWVGQPHAANDVSCMGQ